MSKNPLRELSKEGVSVWLDYLDRKLLRTGRLARLIEEDGIRGETSNPTIFQQGISAGSEYAEDIRGLAARGRSAEEICWEIMIGDVQAACDVFRPLYDRTNREHGYVSLELNPTLAHKTEESIAEGRTLWKRVGRPNLMLKVPGTVEGLPVVETLLSEGLNINTTLLFSVRRYEEVIDRFFGGLEKRLAEKKPIEGIGSVASFFVSRVDTEADKRLDAILAARPEKSGAIAALRGRVAVANSRLAYGAFLAKFGSERWKRLAERGARPQNPLWASTSTKNKAYSDILYVAELIGPHCVNTMPEETIDAFRHHGAARRTLTNETIAEAREVFASLAEIGVDIEEITLGHLVKDGVRKFEVSYEELLGTVAKAAAGSK
ncbi:MAG: transaldolase [Candidatus Eisenbacteria bacterium]|nr:transaldolase [Candidatus Eisenbacteria bacterium]